MGEEKTEVYGRDIIEESWERNKKNLSREDLLKIIKEFPDGGIKSLAEIEISKRRLQGRQS